MLVCCSALQAHKRANLHIISQKCKPKATFSANFPSSGPDAAWQRPFAAPEAGSKRPLPKAGPYTPRPAGEPRRVPKTQGFHPAWESEVCPEIIRDNRKCAPFRQAGHGTGLPEGKPQQKKVRPLTRHRICPDHAEANNVACPLRQAGTGSGLSGLSRDKQRRSSLLSGRTRHRICSSYTGTNNGAPPFLQPPRPHRILPAPAPKREPPGVNEACRQALVRQHVSVQKAEAAFPIPRPPGGGLRPAHRPGQFPEVASGPFSCPNVEPLVRTPPPGSYRSPERHFPRPCDPPTRERHPYRLQFVSRTFSRRSITKPGSAFCLSKKGLLFPPPGKPE